MFLGHRKKYSDNHNGFLQKHVIGWLSNKYSTGKNIFQVPHFIIIHPNPILLDMYIKTLTAKLYACSLCLLDMSVLYFRENIYGPGYQGFLYLSLSNLPHDWNDF